MSLPIGNVHQQPQKEVQQFFNDFSARPLYSILETDLYQHDAQLAIATICRRPEMRPLLRNVTFSVAELGGRPFVLLSQQKIVINLHILTNPVPAAFHMYHALELAALRSCIKMVGILSDYFAVAIAAFHTTLKYLDDMIDLERGLVWQELPTWMQKVASEVRECRRSGDSGQSCLRVISGALRELLPLQSFASPNFQMACTQLDVEQALNKALLLLPLLQPAEKLLTEGGDQRLLVNTQTGLNTYGCSPRPRPWAITFSSCTASSISDQAYQHAEWLRQELFSNAWNGQLAPQCRMEHERIRNEIASLLKLDQVPGTRIILTSSGTDAELYALYFATGGTETPLLNILISSTEIGSGTVEAAGGCHFDEITPLGRKVRKGDQVEGFSGDRVEVAVIELRHDDGHLRNLEELDLVTERLVNQAIASGKRVLIHVLDCSKTGLRGPGLEKVKELRQAHASLVEVVVDAAQMRIGHEALHRYLNAGFSVLVSASKFFTGPPFAGAILIPSPMAQRVREMGPLPVGFSDYSTPYDIPSDWQHLSTNLRPDPNIGLMLRWRSALWEMKAFYSVSPLDQFKTIKTFGSEITRMIRNNPNLELVMAPLGDRGHQDSEVSWDQLPSIFTFVVYHVKTKSPRPLSYDEARFAYQCVNRDMFRFLPVQASDHECELIRKRCHIGQPVRLTQVGGEPIGALRIAAGARLVSGVQFDTALGDTPEDRLQTEIRTAGVIFSKLSVIVKYWDELTQYDIDQIADPTIGYCQF